MQEKSIFRQNALKHYIKSKEEIVMPKLASPQIFPYLWMLLSLLGISVGIAWFVQIPVYASGIAIVQPDEQSLMLVTLVPSEHLSNLQVGQPVFIHTTSTQTPLESTLIAVESEVMSPVQAQVRFDLSPEMSTITTQPLAIATTKMIPINNQLSYSAYKGSTYQVDIEIGSRRFISLLPIIGQIFQK